MVLGRLEVESFLKSVNGLVAGRVVTDAKDRYYRREYVWTEEKDLLVVRRADGHGDAVRVPKVVDLDEPLVSFFGLYSGDGAKGSEGSAEAGRITPHVSFSQKQKQLVRFAVDQFRRLFPGDVRFTFSLGEDAAYFMAGDGETRLNAHYLATTGAGTPAPLALSVVRPALNDMDRQYLGEVRPDVVGTNESHLAFYYQHQAAMQAIFAAEKAAELASVGLVAAADVSITASLRRPFKKGARLPGGSSRSDEIHLGGLNGLGELFLKMMHEIEDSILLDSQVSSQGLVRWAGVPSQIGAEIDIREFFTSHPFGRINGARPAKLEATATGIVGQWRRSSEISLRASLRTGPLWCYVAGLYLAEGTTPKEEMFGMFGAQPGSMGLGFTSSEGTSLELMLRALRQLFMPEDCLVTWKVKVGSQYFPELVVTGLKLGMPMLRGGESGDGKLRTMEISLAVKKWALAIADAPLSVKSLLHADYGNRYSHVEPTGAGVARIDFAASSTLCRWYFPILMFTVFGHLVADPAGAFY